MKPQVQWEDCPRGDGSDYAWSMVQTPSKGSIELICISPKIVGCMVHFWNNRTTGCTGEQCEACEKNRAKFWEGYIACLRSRTLDRVIMRVTQKIGGKINTWLLDRHTLRGACMTFDRPSRTANGRIRLIIQEAAIDLPAKIVEPSMREVLCTIWRIHNRPQCGDKDIIPATERRNPRQPLPGQRGLKMG